MSRIRTIKPELLDDDRAADLPHQAWRLMVSVLVLADDWGRIRASARYLACNVFSGAREGVAEAKERLCRDRFWIPYTVNGEEYAIIRTFRLHQRIDNASRPRLPGPEMADAPVDMHDLPTDEQIAALRASPRDDEDEQPKAAKRGKKSGSAAVRRGSPRNAALPPIPTTDLRSTIPRERERAPDEVVPPGSPTTDGEPPRSLDDPGGPAETSPLPSPAPEVDRPADAKPGPLPRAVDAEADDRLRQAMARANAAPPPPAAEWLDDTAGPVDAIRAYNAHRHQSMPEANERHRGLKTKVLETIRIDRREAKSAMLRGEPDPVGLHRLDGWIALAKRTAEVAHWPDPPELDFWVSGRDGADGALHREQLEKGTLAKMHRGRSSRREPGVSPYQALIDKYTAEDAALAAAGGAK